MSGPRRLAPNQLPDPWLLDSKRLLQELARIREIAVRIPPVRNDILGPINSVLDAVWDLQQRLRYCLHLHCETQRAFRKQPRKLPTNLSPHVAHFKQQHRYPSPPWRASPKQALELLQREQNHAR